MMRHAKNLLGWMAVAGAVGLVIGMFFAGCWIPFIVVARLI